MGRKIDGAAVPNSKEKRRRSSSGSRARSPRRRPRHSRRGSLARSKSPSAWAPRGSPSRSRSRKSSSSDGDDHEEVGVGATGGLKSFKAFVLSECSAETTVEDAAAKYTEYKDNMSKSLFEVFRKMPLFMDLYHPCAKLRAFDLRVQIAQQSARTFMEEMKKGVYEGCSLSAPASEVSNRQGPSCTIAGHMRAPHFALDTDVNSLKIGRVPPSQSVWTLYDELCQLPGFLAAGWTDASDSDLCREVQARFLSEEAARSAVATLINSLMSAKSGLRAELIVPKAELSALMVPPEMSNSDRIRKDEGLSALVLKRLDELMGIDYVITESILKFSGTTEAKLDMQVLYLRRVHNFCFYAGRWCRDHLELRRHCGVSILRCPLPDGAAPSEEAQWAAAHQQRLDAFLESTVRLDRPSCDVVGLEERLAQKMEGVCESKTKRLDDDRFQCTDCNKFFKGAHYVHKHVRKVHTELMGPLYEEIQEESAVANHAADAQKPGLEVLTRALSVRAVS